MRMGGNAKADDTENVQMGSELLRLIFRPATRRECCWASP